MPFENMGRGYQEAPFSKVNCCKWTFVGRHDTGSEICRSVCPPRRPTGANEDQLVFFVIAHILPNSEQYDRHWKERWKETLADIPMGMPRCSLVNVHNFSTIGAPRIIQDYGSPPVGPISLR